MAKINPNDKDRFKQPNNDSAAKKTGRKKPPTPFKYELRINEFAMRGLNKYRNILSAPECKCGCGNKVDILLPTQKELIDFCGTILFENGCCRSAIFLIHHNGKQEVILTVPGYDEEKDIEYIEGISGFEDQNVDAFAKFDAEAGLHCYGMMIEKEPGEWRVCE